MKSALKALCLCQRLPIPESRPDDWTKDERKA